jgi:hypothetical protein
MSGSRSLSGGYPSQFIKLRSPLREPEVKSIGSGK